jgi:hypothetical protein
MGKKKQKNCFPFKKTGMSIREGIPFSKCCPITR